MRNTGFNTTDYDARVPLIEEEDFSSALIEEDIDQKDLQLIDSFSGLKKDDRKLVLQMVRDLLKGERGELAK